MKTKTKVFMKRPIHHFTTPGLAPPIPEVLTHDDLPGGCSSHGSKTLACDVYGTLFRTENSFFPFFVLVAFETRGSLLRAFLLLIAYPLLWLFPLEIRLRVMIFITFCGVSFEDVERVQRAVLPKFYNEDLDHKAYQLFASANKRVVFTTLPRVMVEGYLKEYLDVDYVAGSELHCLRRYYTGFLADNGLLVKHKAVKQHFGEEKPNNVVGFASTSTYNNICENRHDLLFLSFFKEAFVVIRDDRNDQNPKTSRTRHPKPVVLHDGRLAFLPTPDATLSMFMWLPLGFVLLIVRSILATQLPYKLAFPVCSFIGMRLRTNKINKLGIGTSSSSNTLYVSNHRTVLDPLFLSSCIGKPLTTVTYSVSRISEALSFVRTTRLTRDRNRDKEMMQELLKEDDLLIFPEGTTCRERYLLRFSPLFAEITDEIVPIAIETKVSMFYANTATGFKGPDPFIFVLNPNPTYVIHILEKVPKENTCGGGGKSSFEVANCIQHKVGEILGFECTSLSRRDKYMLLAGHQGFVNK